MMPAPAPAPAHGSGAAAGGLARRGFLEQASLQQPDQLLRVVDDEALAQQQFALLVEGVERQWYADMDLAGVQACIGHGRFTCHQQ